MTRNSTSRTAGFTRHEKIDLCRGLFAAMVVVAHAIQIAWVVHPSAETSMSPAFRDVLDAVFRTGTIYVMGFFVISGYCIHLSVARQIENGRFAPGPYLVARLSRILPLYYLGLLLALAVEWAIADARPVTWPHGVEPSAFAGQLILIQNLSETFGSFAPSWSITNEAFYYMLYGLLAWLAAGSVRRPALAGMALCAGVLLVTLADHTARGYDPYVYTLGQLLGLGTIWFLGVLAAIYGDRLVAMPSVRVLARCWPLGLPVVMAWQVLRLTPHGLYVISGLTFTLMMIQFHDGHDPERARGSTSALTKFATAVGLTSYPMYLFHGPLMMLVGSWIMRSNVISDWRLTWVLLVVVGLVVGAAGAWLLERPVMVWRADLLARLKRDRSAASSATSSVPIGAATP